MAVCRCFFVALACGVLVQPVSAATVYKCKGADGGTVFSDTPCGSDAKAVATYGTARKAEPSWCIDGSAPQSLIDSCVDAWRPSLRDPRAAYADGGTLVTQSETRVQSVFVSGYARNGFGGFNPMTMECNLTSAGDIDVAGTESWIKLFLAFSRLSVDRQPHELKNCTE